MNKTHGGKRHGAGRKKKNNNKKSKSNCISMPIEEWEKLDAMRGVTPRGKFIASAMLSGVLPVGSES
jgi:hypothetical protein